MTLLLEKVTHVARKQHRCDVCGGTIGAGDTYIRERSIGDDGPYTFKAHRLCDAAYWQAHRDLDLWSDESPDWFDDIKPLVAGFFAMLSAKAAS